MGLWGLGVDQVPVPGECHFRHGWWSSDKVVFWTGNTFTVLYNGDPLTICESNAGRCTFNVPEG
jgi:hypothetical protein